MKKNDQSEITTLRQKAEEQLLKKLPRRKSKLSEVDVLKLIHELEVHQIELELQNEELLVVKEQSATDYEKYIELYNFAPSGYFTLSDSGKIIELNLLGAKMLGTERKHLINSQFSLFVSKETKPVFNQFFEKVFKSNILETCEVALSTNDYKPKYIQLTGIATQNGKQCLLTAVDITARKLAEHELLQSKQNWEGIFNGMSQPIAILDAEHNVIEVNNYLKSKLGKDLSEIRKLKCWQIFHTPNANCSPEGCPFNEMTFSGSSKAAEIEMEAFGGFYLINCTPVFNDEGKLEKLIHIATDINERKQAEALLRESSERFRAIFEQAAVGIAEVGLNGSWLSVNQRLCEIVGYTKPELLQLTYQDITHPDDLTTDLDYVGQLVSGKISTYSMEKRYIRKDKSQVWINLTVALVSDTNKSNYFISVVEDINERKIAESELRYNEELLRQLLATLPIGVWVTDRAGSIIRSNPAGRQIWEGEKLVGIDQYGEYKGWWTETGKLIEPEEWAAARAITKGEISVNEMVDIQCFDGTKKTIYNSALPIRDANDSIIGSVIVNQDITERIRAEEASRLSEERLELFFTQSLAGFFFMMLDEPIAWDETVDKEKVLDYVFAHQRVTKINEAMLKQYLATEEQFIGLTPNDLFAHDIPGGRKVWRELFDAGKYHVDTTEKRFDGSDMIVEGDYICLFDSQGRITGHFGVQHDITEQKQSESVIHEQAKELLNILANLNSSQAIAKIGTFELDIESGKVWWSDELFKIFEVDPLTYIPSVESNAKFVHPDDNEPYHKAAFKIVETREKLDYVLRIITSNGNLKYCRNLAEVNYDANRKALKMVGSFSDITENRINEEVLLESEFKFRKLFGNAPLPLCYVNSEGVIMNRNERFVSVFGYDEIEVSSLTEWWIKAYPDEEYRKWVVQNWQEAVTQAAETGTDIQSEIYRVTCKDGSLRDVIISGITIDDNFMATFIDVTGIKLAESALIDSEKRYRDLFDANPLPMWVYDLDNLIFLEVNNAAISNYGYSREEFLQMTLKDIRPEKEIARLLDDVGKDRPEYQKSGEWKHQRKDGTLIDVEITSHIIDYKGKKSVLVLSQDITQRNLVEAELRKSEERYSAFVKQSSEAICLFELEHAPLDTSLPVETQIDLLYENAVITENNKTFATSHGYSDPAEMQGIKIGQIFPRLAKENLHYLRSFINGNYSTSQVETKEMNKDGSVTYFLNSLIGSVEDGKLLRIWGAKQDISRIKQVEAEIRHLNAELEQKVIERTIELLVANKELESFSYSVSHDLRAPLRAISGFTNILKEDYWNKLDLQGKKYMDTVLANTKRMGELIDDLLRLSRISKQGLNKSNVKMKELIENVYSELLAETPSDKIKLNIGSMPVAHADSPLLKIALTNLLSNAIKFSSKNDEQIIEFGGKSRGRECEYYIKDNGVGFNMAYSSKLFNVFQRLHRTDEFEGTGIGLAIVQRIIHKHGGRVWAESEVGKGATFYFSIPV